MDSVNHSLAEANPVLGDERADAVRKLISSLLLVRKNFTLYPEGHIICMNGIEAFSRQLDLFIGKFGDLRLDIGKSQLTCQDEVVLSEPPEEGALPFTLYRDGLRWLTFTDGIQLGELMDFMKIISRYARLSDEAEGDIVTDLWETQLPHLKYEVAEYFWETELEEDFTPSPFGTAKGAGLREDDLANWMPSPDPAIEPVAIGLSPEDRAHIRDMVIMEEAGDPTAYLDALLDSLLQHHVKENFEIIIEVFEEEFKKALYRKDFEITLKILKSIRSIQDASPAEASWERPMIEDFAFAVSSPQCIGILGDTWHELDASQAEKAMHTLVLLQTSAIPVLAQILTENQPLRVRDMLVNVIVHLASRDMGPLEAMLRTADDKVMERLVHVFVRLKGDAPTRYLVKLVHHHSSYVRHQALKGLLAQGSASYKDIFSLIEDKDESIRNLVLKQMAQTRDMVAESLLLEYLGNGKFSRAQHGHVIGCFTTLGQCGSQRSVQFLQQCLYGKWWLPSAIASAFREGAIIALIRLKTDQARKVLDEAGSSLNPVVRLAVKGYRR